jgi:allantoin racemase
MARALNWWKWPKVHHPFESEADEQAAIPHLVKLAKEEQGDYDAYIIGCYSDLGIHQMREVVDIPVVGPVRASFSTAAGAFDQFSIMTINQEVIPILDKTVHSLGYASNVKEIDGVEIGVMEIINQPEESLQRFEQSLSRVNTSAVVPGCMSYAYLLAEKGINQMGNIHIINPLRATVLMAESMVN